MYVFLLANIVMRDGARCSCVVGTKSCYGKAVGVILLLVFVHACTIVVRSFQELVLVLLMHIVM